MATISLGTPLPIRPLAPRPTSPRVRPGTSSPSARRTTHRAAHRRPIRVTRRGRLLLLVALAAVAFGLLSMGGGPAPAATEEPARTATAQVVVAAGDSLWSIARSAAPAADPRETIERIRELNPDLLDVPDGSLRPGQALVVPAR